MAKEEEKAMAVADEEVEEVLEEVEEDDVEEEHKMVTVVLILTEVWWKMSQEKRDRAMAKRQEKAKRNIAQRIHHATDVKCFQSCAIASDECETNAGTSFGRDS